MLNLALALLLPVGATTHASVPAEDGVTTFVRRALQTSSFKRADVDLDSDGRKEIIVYVTDPNFCGTGGCLLLVLSPHARSYRIVLRMTVINPPIIALRTATNGWRDLGVTIRGGGTIRPSMARLRFNGHHYTTMLHAVALPRATGTVLIGG